MVWVKTYVAPAPTTDHKRLDALAHKFGVGVNTPAWSSRMIYFYESVAAGRKIELRLNGVFPATPQNMTELLLEEKKLTPEYIAKVRKYSELIEAEENRQLQIEMEKIEEISRLATIAKEKEEKRIEELRIANDALARVTLNAERAKLSAELFAKELKLISLDEDNEIESEIISETIPEVIPQTKVISTINPGIVAVSSLIPLGILAFLLINSSRGKK